jgi:hypothetical protein
MFTGKGFETVIADQEEYERLFCEIYYDGLLVALVSQERGEGIFDLETPGCDLVQERIIRKVDLSGFQEAVETACRRLRGEEP